MTSSATDKKQDFAPTVQTEDFNGEIIVASNDTHSANVTNNQIDAVRSRIKAARLEHLMARQLETDLAIELTVAPQLENEIMAAMSDTTNDCETAIEAYEPYTKAVEERKAFRKKREDCKTLVSRFQNQTSALGDLIESSGGLLSFISQIEAEFVSAELAQKELDDTQIELENLRISNKEQSIALEQQTRQINVLEALQESLSHNFSEAKETIRNLIAENHRIQRDWQKAQEEASSLTQKNAELSKESRNADKTIRAMQEQLLEKEKTLSDTSGKALRISQEVEQERDAYSELQSKYERLNVKSLEYQGQHLCRISELEETTTALKENLENTRREKETLGSELDAVNKLLMLHGEMLDTLSSKSATRSKH